MVNLDERKWKFLDGYIGRDIKGEIKLKQISLTPLPYDNTRISLKIDYYELGLFQKPKQDVFVLKNSKNVIEEAENLQKRVSEFRIPFFDFRSMHEALSETENERIYSALIQMV